jgi:hypothetical protein
MHRSSSIVQAAFSDLLNLRCEAASKFNLSTSLEVYKCRNLSVNFSASDLAKDMQSTGFIRYRGKDFAHKSRKLMSSGLPSRGRQVRLSNVDELLVQHHKTFNHYIT